MTHIEQRMGPAAEWTAVNPVLNHGEAGHESDTGKWKLGDGLTAWTALPYKAGVNSVAGKTGAVALVVADVPDAAPLASPTFTGNPKGPTRATSDSSTSLATTAFVKAVLAGLVAGAPGLLDTLDEIAAALADDPNFAATMTTALAAKAPLASPVLTGDPKAPTATYGDNDTSVASTAFVQAAVLKHTGHGNRLDNTVVAQPSKPTTLRMVTGRISATTNPSGVVSVTVPAGSFPTGVLHVNVTTLTGTGVAGIVNAGAISPTTIDFIWPGVTSTAITFTYMAIGY